MISRWYMFFLGANTYYFLYLHKALIYSRRGSSILLAAEMCSNLCCAIFFKSRLKHITHKLTSLLAKDAEASQFCCKF